MSAEVRSKLREAVYDISPIGLEGYPPHLVVMLIETACRLSGSKRNEPGGHMLTDITLSAIDYICLNLRESDKQEIFNIRPHDNPVLLAWESHYAIRNMGRGRIAWHDGKPAGLFAFTEDWPGCWQVWLFGTEAWKNVAIELVRWARHEANDILTVCEGRRLHCDCREGHPDAHRLLTAMGAVAEGPMMLAYGKDGSAYQRYVWLNGVNDAVLRPHYTRAA